MTQCPECRSLIPDDSAFCDQCGKELKWCPQCGRPKRGTECPVCGSPLVSGSKWLAGGGDGVTPKTPDQVGGDVKVMPCSSSVMPGSSSVMPDHDRASCLVGNGWKLILSEGQFGRVGGIWPELGTCPYVSGNHGRIAKTADGWTITDGGSTNGTFVNGQKVAVGAPTPLKKGDKVRIATLDFTVE